MRWIKLKDSQGIDHTINLEYVVQIVEAPNVWCVKLRNGDVVNVVPSSTDSAWKTLLAEIWRSNTGGR